MDIDRKSYRAKPTLAAGSVRPWHVLFLYSVCFLVGIVAAYYVTKGQQESYRREAWDATLHGITSALILALTLIVPEFRKSLPLLFSRHGAKRSVNEFFLALALALCWGYGLYRIAFCLPVLVLHPEAYSALVFYEALARFEPKYLLLLIGSVLAAPLGEELVFRGYLLNIWIARWGIWPAIVISSLVFGFFHWERALFAAPMGVLFALVYVRYDSLWPAILLHSSYNLLGFPWLLGGLFYVKQRSTVGQLSSWIPELVVGFLFIPVAVLFWKRFKPPALA